MEAVIKRRLGFSRAEIKVIFVSTLGSIFEWYDFMLYGSLAVVLSKQFFAPLNPNIAFIFTLMVFGVGYIVRPLGGIVFGRIGDMLGRKYSFLGTIILMGLPTVMIGLIPGYNTIGIAAPILLIIFRVLQGLAIGGEHCGAAIYIAEHAPITRRAMYISFIPMSACGGLLLSLLAILVAKFLIGDAFNEWGWRLPFIFSIILLAISVWIRLSLAESPAFKRIKANGKISKMPLTEIFANYKNLKLILVATIIAIGGAVVWSIGFIYPLFFMGQILRVDAETINSLIGIALIIACPLYAAIGMLMDRIGRRPVIIMAFLLSSFTTFPLYKMLTHFLNPALEIALKNSPISVMAAPDDCSVQIRVTNIEQYTSPCDIAKGRLATMGVNYSSEVGTIGTAAIIKIGDKIINSYDAKLLTPEQIAAFDKIFVQEINAAIGQAGYPSTADPKQMNKPIALLLLIILVIYGIVTSIAMATILLEMFPTRIRYTAMSLPYNIANGWFAGLLPAASFALIAYYGNIYSGLWYPVILSLIAAVIAIIFLPETKNIDIYKDD